jgi:hypothetical protein
MSDRPWTAPAAIPLALSELADAERELKRVLTELEIGKRADKVIISAALNTVLARVTQARRNLAKVVDANLELRGAPDPD